MTNKVDADGYAIEVIGTCTTNPKEGSQHQQQVMAHHLWSFAQEEALMALCEQAPDKCWRLIHDAERRAKRIAARYADLYFTSAQKSKGRLQLYWPALAAFVVKDIVEAFRYSREQVLNAGWRNVLRTSPASALASSAFTGSSPYEHALRVYIALAKGNLWLFQDIYPWLWYVLEYGLNKDGTLNEHRLLGDADKRDASTLQSQSKQALQELPFTENWFVRLKVFMAEDPVYAQATEHFQTRPAWVGPDGGYGAHQAGAHMAHSHVNQQVQRQRNDRSYRIPATAHWSKFREAYYVLDESRRELNRVAQDKAATARLSEIARFKATKEIRNAYQIFVNEYRASSRSARFERQKEELVEIAKQEQLNVLQPMIYEDAELAKTMSINHLISRYSGGFLSPQYAVVYSASPKVDDPTLKTVFDAPDGITDWVTGPKQSLPNPQDRMSYVEDIAKDFNRLMGGRKRAYMESELRKIQGWLNA